MLLALAATAQMLLFCGPSTARDGDTIYCNGTYNQQIRLQGINAVEFGQPGYDQAKLELLKIVSAGPISCRWVGASSYSRLNAYCDDQYGNDIGQQLLNLHKTDRVIVEWCYYSKNRYGTCPPRDTSLTTWTNKRPN